MNRILYENRCKCNEELAVTKKRKSLNRSEGKPFQYPKSREILAKSFQIKYDKKLPLISKFILNSFQNKYIYYAIDDILYKLSSVPSERDNLLAILYSPIISLQNNFSVNFFDIWIRQISIEEIDQPNKFLVANDPNLKKTTYITIQFFYKTKLSVKKQNSLW